VLRRLPSRRSASDDPGPCPWMPPRSKRAAARLQITAQLPAIATDPDALQGVSAAVGELDVRSGHQVADGTSDEHLSRTGEAGDTSADVHGHASEVVAARDALAGVQTGPDFKADCADLLANGPRATDRTSGAIKAR